MAVPDRQRVHVVEHDPARQDARQPDRVGASLRASSRRHSDHRPGAARAGAARTGGCAQEIFDRRSQAFPRGHPQAFHRMLGQWPDRMDQANAEDGAGHARPAQHLRMDRRAVRNGRARSRPQGRRGMGVGRRLRCGGDDAQHSDRQDVEGRADRLRTERRGAAPRAGLSAASAAARLRGQHAHQMAAPPGRQRQALHDARGDLEVHRPAGGRQSPHVQHGDGREIRHYVSVGRDEAAGRRLLRHPGAGVERPRTRTGGRRVGRWRQDLASGPHRLDAGADLHLSLIHI